MVDQHCQTCRWNDEKLCTECVVVGVVSGLELEEDEIEGAVSGDQKDYLHDAVVRGDKVGEDVEVAGAEDKGK